MKQFKKYFLLLFLPLFLLITAGSVFIYRLRYKNELQEFVSEEEKTLLIKGEQLTDLFEPLFGDIYYLVNLQEVKSYMLDPDPVKRKKLLYSIRLFSTINKNYDQIRILNVKGNEVLRVNNIEDSVFIVPQEQLQDKSHRNYIKKTLSLTPNQVYVSPIDLNVEYGRIETPYQPVIRTCMPLYDSSDNILGMIVTNLKATRYLRKIKGQHQPNGKEFMLLNANGYWLAGPQKYPLYGFMFPGKTDENFGKYFPAIWDRIYTNDNGFIEDQDYLYVFRTVRLQSALKRFNLFATTDLEVPEQKKWHLVSRIPLELINEELSAYRKLLIIAILFSFIFLLGITYIFARQRTSEMEYMINMRKINQTLRNKEAKLSAQNIELAQKNKILEQFVYITSHDLQEPLNTIGSFTELLHEEYEPQLNDENAQIYLHYIQGSAQRMKDMITDLLDYTRIGQKKEVVKKNLNEVLDVVLKDLAGTIHQKKAEIIVNELPELYVYPREIHKLFQNLIGNALKYQKNGHKPVVRINAEKKEHHWKFSVQDNGIGIEPQYKERIFQMFQRLHNKSEYSGTGIGLTNCKRIVELHGGKIWVESIPGAGSTFYFTIPVKDLEFK